MCVCVSAPFIRPFSCIVGVGRGRALGHSDRDAGHLDGARRAGGAREAAQPLGARPDGKAPATLVRRRRDTGEYHILYMYMYVYIYIYICWYAT